MRKYCLWNMFLLTVMENLTQVRKHIHCDTCHIAFVFILTVALLLGTYEPPNCEFDTVRINLTVTSRGRQYDRLGLMFLGDTEVFRTSTAEPTINGIIWTYIKDMSQYD